MAEQKKRSLKSKILLLIFSCAGLITIATSIVAFQSISNVLNKDIAQKMNYFCQTMALETDERFLHIEDTVNNVAALIKNRIESPEALKNPQYRKAAVADIDKFFRAIAQNTVGIVSFYSMLDPELIDGIDGFLYSMNRKGLLAKFPLTDIRNFDKNDIEHVGWFYLPVQHGRGLWMEPYRNRNLNLNMFSYVVPVYKNGTLLGIVGIDVDFKVLVESIDRITRYRSRYAYLKSADGSVHYHLHYFDGKLDGDSEFKILENKDTMQKKDSGNKIIRYKDGGQDRVMAFATLRNGMKLVLTDKTFDVYEDRFHALIIIFIVALALGLAFVLVTIRLASQITKPLEQLTTAAQKITAGQLDINLPAETNDEIGVLIRAFNTTAAHLRKYTSSMETLAYQDAMTKVKNPVAYKLTIENLEKQIQKGIAQFAVVMCDLNNLKKINDNYGHKAGDRAIKAAARIICRSFPYSSIFRIGGDEFVAILQGVEYETRENIFAEFDRQIELNNQKASEACEAVSIARGMAAFKKESDTSYQQVFERADTQMYAHKNACHQASGNL